MSLEKTRQLWRRGCFFAWPVEKTNNPKFIVPLLLLHSLVSGLFFGYQQGTVSVALTPFRKEFPKYFATGNANDLGSSLLSGLLGSSITIGMIGGSILGGFVSAILGFKMTALITCLINFVGAILSATMPLFELIIIARVIAGFGVGIGLVSIPRYVAIMSPKYKQIINVVLGFGAALSLLIAFCFGLGFQSVVFSWRWMFGLIPLIMSVVQFLLFFLMPEAVVVKKDDQPKKEDNDSQNKKEESRIRLMFQRSHIKNLVTSFFLCAAYQLTGVSAILLYTPYILETTGLSITWRLGLNAIVGAFNVVISLLSIAFIKKIGPKRMVIFGTIITGISAFAIGQLLQVSSSQLSGWFCVVWIIVFCFGIRFGPATVFTMVVNDLDWHPKLAVGTLGLVNALSSFMSLLCAFFYLPLVYAIGVSYTFYIFAAIALICVVLLAVLLPGKKKKKKAVALDPTENVANVVESEKQKEMPDHEQPATKEVDQDQQVMQEKELEETKVAADTENTNEYDFQVGVQVESKEYQASAQIVKVTETVEQV